MSPFDERKEEKSIQRRSTVMKKERKETKQKPNITELPREPQALASILHAPFYN